MRPAGEIRKVLLDKVDELTTPDRAPTVKELAAAAGISMSDALNTVKNLKRYGHLSIVRSRRVDYRTKPVAEYSRAQPASMCAANDSSIQSLLTSWG